MKVLIELKRKYTAELTARIKENGYIKPNFIIKEVMDKLFDEIIRVKKNEQ